MEQLLEFTTNHPLLIIAAVVTGAILVYNEVRMAGQGKFTISPDQAVRLMNQGAAVFDLRATEAYQSGHLAGSKNLPLTEIDEKIEAFKRYRKKPVITYDERGLGTARAVNKLRQAEFEHVFSLRGGLMAWRDEHLPLEKSRGKS